MEFICEYLREKCLALVKKKIEMKDLNDNFHQVFLCDDVLTVNNLFQDTWKYGFVIHFQVYPVQLAQPNKIGTNQDT